MDVLFKMDTLDAMIPGIISFHGYKEYGLVYENIDETILKQRAGLILTSLTQKKELRSGHAWFGMKKDTATIYFKQELNITREGKSLAKSMTNAIYTVTDESKVRKQPNPSETIHYNRVEGNIQHKAGSAGFFYSMERRKKKLMRDGWILLNGDTLRLQPVLQHYVRNRIKMVRRSQPYPGVMLVKDNNILAAIDIHSNPVRVYLRKDLEEAGKLTIAAYLYVVAGL